MITAIDGIDALSVYAQHQADIQIVLLDLMMPSLDSVSTVRTLQRINNDISIIVMSGLSTNEPIKNMSDIKIQAFLAKPFTVQALLLTIQEMRSTSKSPAES